MRRDAAHRMCCLLQHNNYNMYYHIQINYFDSDSAKMTLLSEYNIQDFVDLKQRIVSPYIFGHSFNFCGMDLALAIIHSYKVYASELPIRDVNEDGVPEVTRDVIESVNI